MLRRLKEEIVKLKNQDQMKGIDGDQWEDDEHDKDFSTRINGGRCEKNLPMLEFKVLHTWENIIRVLSLLYPSFQKPEPGLHYNLWIKPSLKSCWLKAI